MEQRFTSRNYGLADFEGWNDKGELTLAPKFQRRDVWSDKARSYLVDTIVRGKPIPKIYMRQETNATTRRTVREIVDGQQRLRTVLSFLKDGFKISRTHNKDCGGKLFRVPCEELKKDRSCVTNSSSTFCRADKQPKYMTFLRESILILLC